jgi:hypothetical protein
MNSNSEAQQVQHNTISFQAERMNGNIERMLHLNEILEATLERLVGVRPTTDSAAKGGTGASDTAGVLDYITYKNDVIEEQLGKAHHLLGEITTVL